MPEPGSPGDTIAIPASRAAAPISTPNATPAPVARRSRSRRDATPRAAHAPPSIVAASGTAGKATEPHGSGIRCTRNLVNSDGFTTPSGQSSRVAPPRALATSHPPIDGVTSHAPTFGSASTSFASAIAPARPDR